VREHEARDAAQGGLTWSLSPSSFPSYNEEAVLPALFARLYPALDALG